LHWHLLAVAVDLGHSCFFAIYDAAPNFTAVGQLVDGTAGCDVRIVAEQILEVGWYFAAGGEWNDVVGHVPFPKVRGLIISLALSQAKLFVNRAQVGHLVDSVIQRVVVRTTAD
jgi:hypothetical protein